MELSQDLRLLLADVFALYLKTKNFHWHMKGSHFRDYHLLLDEQANEPLRSPTTLRNALESWAVRRFGLLRRLGASSG